MTNRFYNLPYDLQLLCHQFSNQFVLLNFRKKYNAAIIIQGHKAGTGTAGILSDIIDDMLIGTCTNR